MKLINWFLDKVRPRPLLSITKCPSSISMEDLARIAREVVDPIFLQELNREVNYETFNRISQRKLSRKRVKFDKNFIDTSKADYLGIKSLGMIDYLVNYHHYIWRRYV